MSQVLVAIDSLRTYARSLDNRLKNKTMYPDSWIDNKIDSGYEIVVTKRQPFIKEDVLDLTDYISDGVAKFEVEMDEDVAGYRDIYSTSTDPTAIRWVKTPDNKIMIELDTANLNAADENLITFNYYFFPSTKTGDQYMSTDVYHMVRHAIASSVYDALHDYKRRDEFDVQLEYNSRTMVNGLDTYAEDSRKSNWVDNQSNWY